MIECGMCKYAVLDYEEYYGTTEKQWFVCGCEKGHIDDDPKDCEDFEEVSDD